MTDLDRVTRLRPDVDDPTPDWLAATRQALLDHADGVPARRRPPRRGGLVALAAGFAALAVIALVVPASTMLTAAPKTQFLYVKQGFADEKDGKLTLSEGWYALDSGTPEMRPVASCTPSPGGLCMGSHGGLIGPMQVAGSVPSILDWSRQQLATLPTDPAQLRARLYEMANGILAQKPRNPAQQVFWAGNVDEEVFSLVEGTLVKAIAPPELVTALYQVALTLPGVKTDPNVKDAAGRPGVGLTHAGTGYLSTLVFERAGGRFLGLNDVDVKWPDYVPSTVILSSGLVDHVGERL